MAIRTTTRFQRGLFLGRQEPHLGQMLSPGPQRRCDPVPSFDMRDVPIFVGRKKASRSWGSPCDILQSAFEIVASDALAHRCGGHSINEGRSDTLRRLSAPGDKVRLRCMHQWHCPAESTGVPVGLATTDHSRSSMLLMAMYEPTSSPYCTPIHPII